jgi:hypothetical protein
MFKIINNLIDDIDLTELLNFYNGWLLKFSLRVGYGSFFVFRCTLDTDKFDISKLCFNYELYWLTLLSFVLACV